MTHNFKKGLYPAVKGSGFSMEGYFVWCGSCIKGDDGRYYLFASRWPNATSFPLGYMTSSEIVLATTDSLDKPFKFEKVIFSKRDGYWDGMMTHNPQVVKYKGGYLMYYIGNPDGTVENRRIGVAYSKSLTDGWERPDKPIDIDFSLDLNNPAALVTDDGIYLAFRDAYLTVYMAHAEEYDGKYKIISENIFPENIIEDMFLFENNGRYEIICEDARGHYTGVVGGGAYFYSEDIINWKQATPPMVYDRTVEYNDGTVLELQRRERPQLLVDGERIYLFTTAKINGETRERGGVTWNMLQEFK